MAASSLAAENVDSNARDGVFVNGIFDDKGRLEESPVFFLFALLSFSPPEHTCDKFWKIQPVSSYNKYATGYFMWNLLSSSTLQHIYSIVPLSQSPVGTSSKPLRSKIPAVQITR